MSQLWQSRSRTLDIFIHMPTIKEPIVMKSSFLISYWNKKSKNDGLVIISSLAFTPETKMSSESLSGLGPNSDLPHFALLTGVSPYKRIS